VALLTKPQKREHPVTCRVMPGTASLHRIPRLGCGFLHRAVGAAATFAELARHCRVPRDRG
jgi:hypothetical protein